MARPGRSGPGRAGPVPVCYAEADVCLLDDPLAAVDPAVASHVRQTPPPLPPISLPARGPSRPKYARERGVCGGGRGVRAWARARGRDVRVRVRRAAGVARVRPAGACACAGQLFHRAMRGGWGSIRGTGNEGILVISSRL